MDMVETILCVEFISFFSCSLTMVIVIFAVTIESVLVTLLACLPQGLILFMVQHAIPTPIFGVLVTSYNGNHSQYQNTLCCQTMTMVPIRVQKSTSIMIRIFCQKSLNGEPGYSQT